MSRPSVRELRIELYRGPREDLLSLFRLADDSPGQLASYLDSGRVLVALSGSGEVLGHLQLASTDDPGQLEIKNMAVREDHQGHGIGARLVRSAIEQAEAESATAVVVATASADVGNLRFYQRQGFRLRSVERDAFTTATGYPPGLRIDGIRLRDRVWLDQQLEQPS